MHSVSLASERGFQACPASSAGRHRVPPVAVAHLSEHVQVAVEGEREVVAARLEALRAQSLRLHELVEKVDAGVGDRAAAPRDRRDARARPQLSLEAHGELRGQKLQEIAVELLRQERGTGVTVHYREWFGLMLAAGLHIAGKDPLGTFLTQVARAPSVESVKPRSGLYRLRTA